MATVHDGTITLGGKRFVFEESRECRVMLKPNDFDTLLNLNTANRPVSGQWVNTIVKRMNRGEWRYNGDSIRISRTGVLLNGQHTLIAARRVGKPLDALIVTGLPDETWSTMDDGRRRSLGQFLGKDGVPNYNAVSSLCQLVFKYHRTLFNRLSPTVRNDASIDELKAVIEDDATIQKSVSIFTSNHGLRKVGCATVTFVIWGAMNVLSGDRFDKFLAQLLGNDATKRGDPVYEYRERLKDNRAAKAKLPVREIIAIGIKTVNYFKANQQVRCLKWTGKPIDEKSGNRSRKQSVEDFPEFDGFPPKWKVKEVD